MVNNKEEKKMKRIPIILLIMIASFVLISATNFSELNVSVTVSAETPVTPPSTGGGGGTTKVAGD